MYCSENMVKGSVFMSKGVKCLLAVLIVGYLVLLIELINLSIKEADHKQWIDLMTEKIYKQEQQISYYEKLLEIKEGE